VPLPVGVPLPLEVGDGEDVRAPVAEGEGVGSGVAAADGVLLADAPAEAAAEGVPVIEGVPLALKVLAAVPAAVLEGSGGGGVEELPALPAADCVTAAEAAIVGAALCELEATLVFELEAGALAGGDASDEGLGIRDAAALSLTTANALADAVGEREGERLGEGSGLDMALMRAYWSKTKSVPEQESNARLFGK